MNKATRAAWEYLGQPVMRGIVTIIAASSYNLFMTWMMLFFLPFNFNYYNTLLTDQGTTVYDAYLFWTWLPTIFIFLLGMFWSSGLLGKMGHWIGL